MADAWDQYTSAGFSYDSPAGTWWVLPAGEVEAGSFPFDRPAVFVTAWNPGNVHLAPEENERRGAALEAEVRRLGCRWCPAVGGLPAGHENEPGVLLLDVELDAALALGARFQQDAVYVWRPDALETLSCDGRRSTAVAWHRRRATELPPGGV